MEEGEREGKGKGKGKGGRVVSSFHLLFAGYVGGLKFIGLEV